LSSDKAGFKGGIIGDQTAVSAHISDIVSMTWGGEIDVNVGLREAADLASLAYG
jgi:hypothetical protein